jgi:putative transposase
VSVFIDEHRDRFGVEPICRVLGVSASAYYHRATGQPSPRALEDQRLLERIRETHRANYEAYGYRRTWKALRRAGETAPRCRVQRLMREHGIQGAKRRGKPWRTTVADPDARRRPDLVQRNFTAAEPDRLWVGDLSYLRCWEGVVYFAFVLDVFSRRVVGWQLAGNMRTTLVLDALRMALGIRDPGADFRLVAHTDRGSQYTSAAYTQALDDHRVLASVGSVGDAYDNAMAESFVDSFKTELIADRVWRSRSQLELAVVEYISWFNHARLHQALGDIPPVEFEQAAGATTAQPPGPAVALDAVHRCEAGTTPPGSSPIYGVRTS